MKQCPGPCIGHDKCNWLDGMVSDGLCPHCHKPVVEIPTVTPLGKLMDAASREAVKRLSPARIPDGLKWISFRYRPFDEHPLFCEATRHGKSRVLAEYLEILVSNDDEILIIGKAWFTCESCHLDLALTASL